MKILLLTLVVVAFTAHSALGFARFPSFPSVRIDTRYAAGGSLQCDLCEMVVGDIQSILKGDESEIENFLDSICAVLPKEYQANCTNLIDTYLPLLFTLIDDMEVQDDVIHRINGMVCRDRTARNVHGSVGLAKLPMIREITPAEVCELLTLCSGEAEVLAATSRMGSMTSVLNRYMSRLSRLEALKERRISCIRSGLEENYLCNACEEAIGFVHDVVANNQTWGEIAMFLMPLCELCPYRADCQNFFFELPGEVNEFANEYLDPVRDCQIFGFCPKRKPTTTQAPQSTSIVYDWTTEWPGATTEFQESTTGVPGDTTEGRESTTLFKEPTTKVEEPTTVMQEVEEPEQELEVPIQLPIQPRAHLNEVVVNQMIDGSGIAKKKKKQAKKLGKNVKYVKKIGRMRKPRSIFVEVGDEVAANQIPYDVYDSEGYGYDTVPDHKKCEVCRYFSSAAEGVLEYNEADITNGLTIVFQDICEAIPEQFKDECTSEVTDVLPGVIYQMVLKLMNPDYLCTTLIGICK